MLKSCFNLSVRKCAISACVGQKVSHITASRSLSLKPNFSKLKLTPPPAGGVVGGINDKVEKPDVDFFHGSYHWDYERITAISLIPLTLIPMYGALSSGTVYPMIDATLCSVLLIHVQLGLTSCIVDYIPKRKFGVWHKMAMAALYSGTAVGLYGVYELETSNNGLIDLIAKLWKDEDAELSIFSRS
ncbi:LANO_0F10880g1_1 [Lachancea nothofagi CBS 11611]|uniref:Succinate dehydrogenase [ubiquinone] cytochrome b small subunit n=1 Tax=Lachancea nothofagi CBS 11611 TaxID=1266666 RepID=A0A1G4KAL1_9SACH|nr:LANO_0F10880g1_1 [Lachancea nothofagi CBS 11611]